MVSLPTDVEEFIRLDTDRLVGKEPASCGALDDRHGQAC